MVSVKQTVVTELGRGGFPRFPEDHNVDQYWKRLCCPLSVVYIFGSRISHLYGHKCALDWPGLKAMV